MYGSFTRFMAETARRQVEARSRAAMSDADKAKIKAEVVRANAAIANGDSTPAAKAALRAAIAEYGGNINVGET